MKGTSIIIDAMRGVLENSRTEWNKPIDLKTLQEAVGGPIETIPLFDCMNMPDGEHMVQAFCNEEGKISNLPFNEPAQGIWTASIAVTHGIDYEEAALSTTDYLVGNIIVVWGDDEFMSAL